MVGSRPLDLMSAPADGEVKEFRSSRTACVFLPCGVRPASKTIYDCNSGGKGPARSTPRQIGGDEEGAVVTSHRHGSRTRLLTGTFGPIEIVVPRARLNKWNIRAYQRRTLAADALIPSTYLAGTNTRRVRRALSALFGGAVGKEMVSRTWRKVKR